MPQAVRINGTGQVVQADRRVHVSKPKQEDVLWIATQNGGPWTITFDKQATGGDSTYPVAAGSPFSQSSYTVAQGASNGSAGGPVNGTGGRTYRYNVKDQTGRITDDPDIDVDP
jgi:hypothetical protein